MDEAHPNYRFVVSQIRPLAGINAKALDYGCGQGETVKLARSKGVDMVGADVFYAGDGSREIMVNSEDFGRTIFEMTNGRLPFPDHSFDIVTSNQVFEHVQDIDLALAEIRRVLKPGGVFLNIFPSIGILREGHCGVPFAHWLNPAPAVQRLYLRVARFFGLGYFTEGKSRSEWAAGFSTYLRHFTHYRTRRAIHRAYAAHFAGLRHDETQFAIYRLRASGRRHAADVAARVPGLTAAAVRRLGSMVIVARIV